MSLHSVPKQDMLLFKHIPLPRGKIRNKKLSAKPHEMLGVNLQKTNISHRGKAIPIAGFMPRKLQIMLWSSEPLPS